MPTQTQLRREARKRREFLYTKSLEQKEQQIWQRKQAVRDLLAKGKQAPRGYGAGERELKMDAAQDGERARSPMEGLWGEGALTEAIRCSSDDSHRRRVCASGDRGPASVDHHLARPVLETATVCKGASPSAHSRSSRARA